MFRGPSVNDGDDVPGCEAELQRAFKDARSRFDSARGEKMNPVAIKQPVVVLLSV